MKLFFLLLLAVLDCGTSQAAILNVTSVFHRTLSAGVTMLAFTTPVTPTAGNRVLLDINCDFGSQVSSITQTNVAWTRKFAVNGNQTRMELWLGIVSASPSTSVTINVNASDQFIVCKYSEWSGLGTSLVGVAVTSLGGTSNTVVTGNKTTTYANVLLLANLTSPNDSYSTGPTNSFTQYASSGAPIGVVPMTEGGYRIVTSTGTYSTGWTVTGSNFWDNWILAIGDSSFSPSSGSSSLSLLGLGP